MSVKQIRLPIIVVVFCMGLSALAEQVVVTIGKTASIDVAEGASKEQTDRISVQDGGRLYKTGTGDLVFSKETVLQQNPFTLGVRQGSVTLKADGVAPDETADEAAALATMNTAAFWVRADTQAGLVVTNGNLVAQWRDVREGAVSDPDAAHTYPYALPKWDASLSSKPLYGTPPCLSNACGKAAVYFGLFSKIGHGYSGRSYLFAS